MADKTGGAKTKKRKSKTVPKKEQIAIEDDACTTCSICQSKLVMFSGINKYNLSEYLQKGKMFSSTSNLKCSACGSSLCSLNDLPKS
ncbi:hypothetical protein [Turkeypox virus]|uniref:Uncharacterized protein n=1 Tax=Turkeypox virus TaxID=336486 RepID=A0A0M5I1C4_9POXV|nr:hypothetical protein ASN15_gp134 [Turkeypox virus]ALA62508.1 hypothetical protein [Turkeypox virus]